jgi:hypothetical protein
MNSCVLSLISALGGMGDQRHAPGHFTPRKDPVPIVQEAGWPPGPVVRVRKISPQRNSIPGPTSPKCSFIYTISFFYISATYSLMMVALVQPKRVAILIYCSKELLIVSVLARTI